MIKFKNTTILRKLTTANTSDKFTVSEDEHLTVVLLAKENVDYSLKLELAGRGAEADIFGIIIGNKNHKIRINTLQQHSASETKSNLLIKSVLTERSFLQYEGVIQIAKMAQRSNAYQRNDSLLLSSEAKAESRPTLEILANDVRCTHGATIGRIDQEQLFYLQSRGIEKEIAERLIIEGFFQVIIDQIEDDKIKLKLIKNLTELAF